jgi:subtilisin family serine protease
MKKLVFTSLILAIAALTVSGVLIAKADKNVRVFIPSQNILDKLVDNLDDFISKLFSQEKYKRFIFDFISEQDIDLIRNKGCLLKHKLKGATSFECPENVVLENARESRVFHIVDFESDQQIQADLVWSDGVDGTGVNVVILDTGIDADHVELSDSVIGQKDFVNNDNVAEDDHGHGTHVAGIITANGINIIDGNYATGVSPGAGVYMLKVCDGSGSCYEDDMIAAMEYAVNTLDAKVMSISIGGGNFGSHCDSDSLAAKVNWVVDNGIIVMIAAGNDGRGVSSPACASKAVAVGAVDKSGVVPYWSNRGSALDIVAPGVDILSTYSCLAAGDCSSYWYAWMDGTSMSTPHVAGVAALLLEANSSLSVDGIKSALYSTAMPASRCYECTRWSWWSGRCISQSEVSCTPGVQGVGIVNAYQAYLSVKSTDPDADGDGIPDSQDACPATYGLDCNGCPNPCAGCAVMNCEESTPTCIPGTCPDTICPEEGCGVETCQENEYGTYTPASNTCEVINNTGNCNNNPCTLECIYDIVCEPDADGDGIPDSMDACPETYGTYCDGCPEPVCTGCQVSHCPVNGTPSCVDDDSLCAAPNAVGMCSSGSCLYECIVPYDNCNSDWSDGCEVNVDYDSDNCGYCGNVCGSITCPASGCSVGGCGPEEYGYYPAESQTSCVSGSCSGECEVSCSYDASCDSDDDDDGILDVDDACPTVYGTDCNGCPNPCSGCAMVSCDVGPPTCIPGNCLDTMCQADGCGVGSCLEDEYGTYSPSANDCEIVDNIGTCTSNPCTLTCVYASSCDVTGVECWSSAYEFIYRSKSQMKKFCKCAEGNYGYESYSYSWGRKTVYLYIDSGDNENWDVKTRYSYLPVHRVRCTDGNWYYTNQDHYFVQ